MLCSELFAVSLPQEKALRGRHLVGDDTSGHFVWVRSVYFLVCSRQLNIFLFYGAVIQITILFTMSRGLRKYHAQYDTAC